MPDTHVYTTVAASSHSKLEGVAFRLPTLGDGRELWRAVSGWGGLELNSTYSYLMVCRNFRDTSIVAEYDGEVVGFISGHRPQEGLESVFVWQIGVDPGQRGKGLGIEMLTRLLKLPGCRQVHFLEATVTPSNKASQRMFRGLARHLNVPCVETLCFPSGLFPEGGHEAEYLFRIGPF